jgi:hypothetical protein
VRLQQRRNLLQERVQNGSRDAKERRELFHPLLPPAQKMMTSYVTNFSQMTSTVKHGFSAQNAESGAIQFAVETFA